jgi:hypothetical protein
MLIVIVSAFAAAGKDNTPDVAAAASASATAMRVPRAFSAFTVIPVSLVLLSVTLLPD